jgi:phage shock protein A
MLEPKASDPQFDTMTARLLRREALRRAAEELNTTSGPGLEAALARISDEVTAEAADRHAAEAGGAEAGGRDTITIPPVPKQG